jgi:hypothetical protein
MAKLTVDGALTGMSTKFIFGARLRRISTRFQKYTLFMFVCEKGAYPKRIATFFSKSSSLNEFSCSEKGQSV